LPKRTPEKKFVFETFISGNTFQHFVIYTKKKKRERERERLFCPPTRKPPAEGHVDRPGETNSFNTWLQRHKVILMTGLLLNPQGHLGW
jgi:hypothetical protein